MEQDNNKMITQELRSAVKTIKAAILQSQVPELPGLKGFSEENIKLMRRFYETWKDIETISVVPTTEITNFNIHGRSANSVVTTDLQKADSEVETIRQWVLFFARRLIRHTWTMCFRTTSNLWEWLHISTCKTD